MQTPAQELLDFWFGQRPISVAAARQRTRLWFGDSTAPEVQPQIDELLRQRYGALCRQALGGQLVSWESSPRRRLALILLLDQLPRNIHRGSAGAFVGDREAQRLTAGGMQAGFDAVLEPLERLFFYMPLQHAESLELQEESVAAFRRLAAEAPAAFRELLEGTHHYAAKHHAIIARFGRFPHRNLALERESTHEERAWLEAGGERFGQ